MTPSQLPLDDQRVRYLHAALAGNVGTCTQVTDSLLESGAPVLSIYRDLLIPVQRTLGELWESGQIDVGQEHLATNVNLTLMGNLRPLLKPKHASGYRVVIASVDGDYHYFGARLVADYFLADGWQVDFLGASVPPADLAKFTAAQAAHLVALSVSYETALPQVVPTVQALRNLQAPPHILLGGPALPRSVEELTRYSVDGVVADAADAVAQGRALVGATTEPLTFEAYLVHVGQRLRLLRVQRAWNQERLAEASGLDRTYISAVENGKQNLTLRALMALATALEVPPERMLSERG